MSYYRKPMLFIKWWDESGEHIVNNVFSVSSDQFGFIIYQYLNVDRTEFAKLKPETIFLVQAI